MSFLRAGQIFDNPDVDWFRNMAIAFAFAKDQEGDSSHAVSIIRVANVDLDQDFTLTADALVSGWGAGNENNKIEVNVGCI